MRFIRLLPIAALVAVSVGLLGSVGAVAATGSNGAPVAGSALHQFSLPENQDGSETPVSLGTFPATDPDGDAITYFLQVETASSTLEIVDRDGPYRINQSTGVLSYTGPALDYEAYTPSQDGCTSVRSLRVILRDGNGGETAANARVCLTDVLEPPDRMPAPTIYTLQGGFVAVWPTWDENVDRYAIRFRREGSNDDFSYRSRTDKSQRRIEVDGLELGEFYKVRIRAINAAGKSRWSPVTRYRTQPGFTQNGRYSFELPENVSGAGTPVVLGNVAVDGYDRPPSFSISGSRGNFRLNSSTGQLTYVGSGEDHESVASHTIRIRANGLNTAYGRVTVDVTDVRERPERMAAPTVNAQSNHRLDVSWVAPDNAGKPYIESYEVKYRLMPDGQAQVVSFDPESSDFLNTVINAGAAGDYRVRIRALSHEGHGRWSPYTAVTACSTCP